MRNYYLFIFILILGSCQNQKDNTQESDKFDQRKEIAKVNEVMDNWHLAAVESNFENYFNAMDTLSVFIGTDASENWDKNAFMKFSKPYFDKGEAWSFTALERNIYFSEEGKVAWFDELLDTWMGLCRGSGVLEKEDSRWLIKHYVLSVSVPNELMDSVISIKQEVDSSVLSKLKDD